MSKKRTRTGRRRENIRALQARLLHWYRHHKRALPWRSRPTPYRVWIAEVMLQQTRVQTVLPYYQRFLLRFPNIKALAAAHEQEVLQLWAGLGYYRRARHLLESAKLMANQFDSRFPATFEEIRRLPGVGRYTAGAIYSIAFNQPQPVVDGNVKRVIGRFHGLADAPEAFCWHQAELWLARDQPADFNQAVMELGALVCIPRNPLCDSCPLQSLCKSGRARKLPPAPRRSARARESVTMVMLVVECAGKILLVRRSMGGFIPGEWGLPICVLPDKRSPLTGARNLVRHLLDSTPRIRLFPSVRHAITHRNIVAHVCMTSLAPPPPRLSPANRFRWRPLRDIEDMLTSSLFRKGLMSCLPTANGIHQE